MLHEASTLSPAERELIAAYVSFRNDSTDCQTCHGAVAAYYPGGDQETILQVNRDFERAPVSDKLKALLVVADKVQRGGKNVLPEDISRARRNGASDRDIHDTVLIAAAICMYNRYVDALATWATRDLEDYRERAGAVAREGCPKIPPGTGNSQKDQSPT